MGLTATLNFGFSWVLRLQWYAPTPDLWGFNPEFCIHQAITLPTEPSHSSWCWVFMKGLQLSCNHVSYGIWTMREPRLLFHLLSMADWIFFDYVSEFKDLAVVDLSATAEALMTTSWMKKEAQTWKDKQVLSREKAHCHSPRVGGGVVWDFGSERDVPGSLLFYCGDDPAQGCLMLWGWSEMTRRIQKNPKYILHCCSLRGPSQQKNKVSQSLIF